MSVQTGTPTTAPAPERTYAAYSRPFWKRVVLSREFAVIVLLIGAFIFSRSQVDYFDGPQTLYYLFRDSAAILLLALPMTAIIITGEIDLSVASTVALTSVAFGMLHVDGGLSMPLAGLIAIGIGLLCGAFNGVLVAYVGLPSIAVTIGTMALFRGIASGLLGTESRTDFPDRWTDLAKQRIVEDQPYLMILIAFVVLAVLFVVMLHFSSFGRGIFEIGLNDEAAHFTGVDVARTKAILFVLAGAVAAFVGIYTTLVTGVARAENSMGLELQGDRGGAARRGVDLRRSRCAARRDRRRAAHRHHRAGDAPQRPDDQHHQHRHRDAPRALGDVHGPDRLGAGPVGPARAARLGHSHLPSSAYALRSRTRRRTASADGGCCRCTTRHARTKG